METLRLALGEGKKKQIIFEVETLAALLATSVWRSLFGCKRVILFVDNEGTKFSLLRGVSDNACVDMMAEAFAKLENQLHAMIWIARVPSKSNVADPPSKGLTDIPFNAIDVSELAGKCRFGKWGRRLRDNSQLQNNQAACIVECGSEKLTLMKVVQRINTCDVSLSFMKMNLKRLFRKLSVRLVGGRVALAFVLQQNPPSTASTTWSSSTFL